MYCYSVTFPEHSKDFLISSSYLSTQRTIFARYPPSVAGTSNNNQHQTRCEG